MVCSNLKVAIIDRKKEKEENIFYYMVIFLTNEIVLKVAEHMVEYTRGSIELARKE